MKTYCICISKHCLFRLVCSFELKCRMKTERLPHRLLGNIKQGSFNSPLLLLIYPQRLCGAEYCKRYSCCYNWTGLNFSSIFQPPTLTIIKKSKPAISKALRESRSFWLPSTNYHNIYVPALNANTNSISCFYPQRKELMFICHIN